MGFAGELGMALGALSIAQHQLREDRQAWASLREAVDIFVKVRSRFTLFTLATAVVILLADTGKLEQAVEAYSAVMTDPIVANSRWFVDMVGNRMDLAKENLPEDVYQAAEKRGRESDPFEVFGKLAQEMNAELALFTTPE
jgi:hypothetical protein